MTYEPWYKPHQPNSVEWVRARSDDAGGLAACVDTLDDGTWGWAVYGPDNNGDFPDACGPCADAEHGKTLANTALEAL